MEPLTQFIEHFKSIFSHFSPTVVQLIISAIVLFVYGVLSRRIAPFLYKTIAASVLKEEMNRRALVVFHILMGLLLVVVLSIVWGVDIKGLLVLASSMIAVVGVALFAAWSLISNVTAFFIMLGQRIFAPGNEVKILDGANFVEGRILEINLFSTVLVTKNNEHVVYPNNLIVSRPVVVQPPSTEVQESSRKKIEKRWRRQKP